MYLVYIYIYIYTHIYIYIYIYIHIILPRCSALVARETKTQQPRHVLMNSTRTTRRRRMGPPTVRIGRARRSTGNNK